MNWLRLFRKAAMGPRESADLPDPERREGALVAQMFNAIAPTYDFLNHLLSLNVDRYWRRVAIRTLEPVSGGVYLDLCTGTGDLAVALLKRASARVVGLDFSRGMMARAIRKAGAGSALDLVQGDALDLPLADRCVDGAMVAFGVRNFEDLDRGFLEMARVLRPGGRAVILEFSEPRGRLFGSLFRFYFRRVLPVLGRLISPSSGAYNYLPASVSRFPDSEELKGRFKRSGFLVRSQRPLTGGIATLHCVEKPAEAADHGPPSARSATTAPPPQRLA